MPQPIRPGLVSYSSSVRVIDRAYLDVSVEGKTRSRLDETTDLGTREVLGDSGEFGQVDIAVHDAVVPHLASVNVQNLESTRFIR